jgi:D-alanyl-lipoteichoic acid acyltransferase DltB (MBOAT superfamily)
VYRGKIRAVGNFFDFAFYVSFFPQLVAGPIVRAAQFLPQVYARYQLTIRQMGHALFLIANGLVKKVLISDTISIHFVDRVFDAPMAHTGFQNLLALYGYALQIYCDFSGYTDMAIGVALLFGFRLPINFNSPYKAVNLTDFWRRWHISLSSWLRDYLYISLGGNRKGRVRTGVNIMVTMLLGGLWHGASWKFIIWGGCHGLGLLIQKGVQSVFRGKRRPCRLGRFLAIFATFHFVTLLWLVFRADSVRSARIMLQQILFDFNFKLIPDIVFAYRYVLVLVGIGYLVHWLPSRLKEWYRGRFIRLPLLVKALLFIVLFFILYQVKSTEFQPFIYFRF